MRSITGLLAVEAVAGAVSVLTPPAAAQVAIIERTPVSVGSANTAYFTARPTQVPALFLGFDPGASVRTVDFNTAPDGALTEGGSVTTQYASRGVIVNAVRISGDIYGGNNYGAGFATEHNPPQVYTFTSPVSAVGIVNTSPDRDLYRFYSGPDGTGTLLLQFNDQATVPINFNIDRFLGASCPPGTTIGSMVCSNASGDLELDELIFVIAPTPACDPIDFNGDGLFPDTQDIIDFLTVFAGGACPTGTCGDIDFNNDGLFPDVTDIDDLLRVFSGGPCP